VRTLKVWARSGTGMQTTLRPGTTKRTSRWPNRRMLSRPLKIVARTRAGRRLTTTTRTHLERSSDRSEIWPGAVARVGPAVTVWGLGMVFWRLGAGGGGRAGGGEGGGGG